MTLTDWLACAISDAEQRKMAELTPVLEALARATAQLRSATWNADASGTGEQAKARTEAHDH